MGGIVRVSVPNEAQCRRSARRRNSVFATLRHARAHQILLLTVAGLFLAAALLALNGISFRGMLASYAAAAAGRGALSTFGFRGYSIWFLARIAICLAVMSLPFVLWLPRFAKAWQKRNIPSLAYLLLYVLAPAISIFAMFTNGELKDVEWALFLAPVMVLLFEQSTPNPGLRRAYIAFLCTLVVSDLYLGAIRYRVAGIGQHMFYEWKGADIEPGDPFFRDLRASSRFRSVIEQTAEVIKSNPQPVFFGPRLEFSYAAFGLGSPRRLPVWWRPGTSFRASDEPALLAVWRDDRFATLIFLKDDYTYYSVPFLRLIKSNYRQDDRYSELTVFHAKRARSR